MLTRLAHTSLYFMLGAQLLQAKHETVNFINQTNQSLTHSADSLPVLRGLKGQVFDYNREVLFGVDVILPNGSEGVATGKKGRYHIKVSPQLGQLKFVGDGMDTGLVTLGDSDTLNVILLMSGTEGIDPALEMIQYTQPSKRSFSIQVKGNISFGVKTNQQRPYVRIEGTSIKIYGDEAGNFEILVPPGRDILSFECEGFPARKVLLPDLSSVYIPVTLWPEKYRKPRKLRR